MKRLEWDVPPRFENEVAPIRYIFRFLWYFGGMLATLPAIRPPPHSKIRGDDPANKYNKQQHGRPSTGRAHAVSLACSHAQMPGLDRTYEMSALLNFCWLSSQMLTLRFTSIYVLHSLAIAICVTCEKGDRVLLRTYVPIYSGS